MKRNPEALYAFDEALRAERGVEVIAGFDEAGRGPLCGPVACAGCVLPSDPSLPFLDDSKKLSPKGRKRAFEAIKKVAITFCIRLVSPFQIDRFNILEASRIGMERCLERIRKKVKVDFVITDYMKLSTDLPVLSIPKGDATSACVAAASILAKVTRDRFMEEIASIAPEYCFDRHKGYPTEEHLALLREHGLIRGFYRESYKPVAKILKEKGYNAKYDDLFS